MAGPLGNWDWRKYLPASLDLSLRRLGVEYSACAPEETRGACALLRELGTECLIHQPRSYDRYLAILALGGAAFGRSSPARLAMGPRTPYRS